MSEVSIYVIYNWMSLKLLLPVIAWGGVGVEGLEWYSYRKKDQVDSRKF